jgi:putative phosphoesterase
VKLGVLADSHDHLDRLRRAVEVVRAREVTALIHAGDFVSPFSIPLLGEAGIPVFGVCGNNDGERVGLKARFAEIGGQLWEHPLDIEIQGRRLLVLHEPFGLDGLVAAGTWSAIVYGHTHQVDYRLGSTVVLNPGEVCGWVTGRPTAAVLDLETGEAEILDLS